MAVASDIGDAKVQALLLALFLQRSGADEGRREDTPAGDTREGSARPTNLRP
jgi:hypothetical protein